MNRKDGTARELSEEVASRAGLLREDTLAIGTHAGPGTMNGTEGRRVQQLFGKDLKCPRLEQVIGIKE